MYTFIFVLYIHLDITGVTPPQGVLGCVQCLLNCCCVEYNCVGIAVRMRHSVTRPFNYACRTQTHQHFFPAIASRTR